MRLIQSNLCAVAILAAASQVGAQSVGQIQISSPVGGAVLLGGSTLNVSAVPSGLTCIGVTIIASQIGVASLTQPPYNASFTLPQNFNGANLQAFCLTSSNTLVQSAVVSVAGPATTPYTNLTANPTVLTLSRLGDQMPLAVYSTDQSGVQVTITRNSQVSYSSDNPNIANVSSVGLITAAGSGSTIIRVRSGSVTSNVGVTILQSMRGDLNGDGRVDVDDVNSLQQWLNTGATSPNDARDLNHDGKIDALDLRILTTMCTYPRCATHL